MRFVTYFFIISMFIILIFAWAVTKEFTRYEWYSGLLLLTITGKILLNDKS